MSRLYDQIPREVVLDRIIPLLSPKDFMQLERSCGAQAQWEYFHALMALNLTGFHCEDDTYNHEFMNWIEKCQMPLNFLYPGQYDYYHVNCKILTSLAFDGGNGQHNCIMFYLMICQSLKHLVINGSMSATSKLFQCIPPLVMSEKLQSVVATDCPLLDGTAIQLISERCFSLAKLVLTVKGRSALPCEMLKIFINNRHTLIDVDITLCIHRATFEDANTPLPRATYRQHANNLVFDAEFFRALFNCTALGTFHLRMFHNFSLESITEYFTAQNLAHITVFSVESKCSSSCSSFSYTGFNERRLVVDFNSMCGPTAASVCNLLTWIQRVFTNTPFHLNIADDTVAFPWAVYRTLVSYKNIEILHLVSASASRDDLLRVFGEEKLPNLAILTITSPNLTLDDAMHIVVLNSASLIGFPVGGLARVKEADMEKAIDKQFEACPDWNCPFIGEPKWRWLRFF